MPHHYKMCECNVALKVDCSLWRFGANGVGGGGSGSDQGISALIGQAGQQQPLISYVTIVTE